MKRKGLLLLITIMMLTSMSFAASVVDDSDLCLHNANTVTTDLDSTFIQGDVKKSCGQRIIVRNSDGFVTEKILPNTGQGYRFRIKLPSNSINKTNTTTFAVKAFYKNGKESETEYARFTYKAKKKQQITVSNKELALKMPGEGVAIDAASSAGLKLDYSSSDESVVKVDSNGNVEPTGGGTAEILVSQKNNCEYLDAAKTVKVSVKALPYFTVRYHLGAVDAEDLQNAGDTSTEKEITLIAGAYIEDEEDPEDMIAEQKIAVDEPTKLLEAAEKKGDYEFIGWATTSTGYPSYDNGEEVTNLVGADEIIDLYAVWHGERAQKAVDWAEDLAADDRYGYGQGTSRCNICGLMPKKQYTCMPFLAAAYAHGAGDPVLFANGVHKMYLNDKNFRGDYGTVWEKIGLCRDLSIEDLRPGDVIIKWSDNDASGHAWMYAGDDLIVEAVPASSYANQIAVKEGAAAKLRRYGSSEGTPGKNYVMRYRF